MGSKIEGGPARLFALSFEPNRTNLKPQGGILELSGGVFSGVMEIHFYAFFNGFWPKTGIWPILEPRGPLSSHLDEMSENINFP